MAKAASGGSAGGSAGVSASSRFFGWVRPREPAPEADPADLGTAFGLELSLGEPADYPDARPDTPTAGEEPGLREPPRY